MAESGSSSPQSGKPDRSDRDLVSIAEARSLARRAKQAWLELAEFDQARIDAIVDAMAAAATSQAEMFARLAVEETGYGVVEDKIQKNLFSSQKVYQFIRPMKTVAVILATGGMGLVRAAYSAGKPAYGVGPGNAPAFIERTANVKKAVHDIIAGKTFDNGVLCSSENSVVVDEAIAEDAKREFQAQGGYFMNKAEMDLLARQLISPQRLPNPALVGKTALVIAEKCGITVPTGTRVLLAPLDGVGRDYPLSIEKLCPVLSYYVVRDWREGCERCKQILRYGGMGHTMSIHSQNEQVILEFGLKKPAYRIIVNSATTHGSVGLSTGLDPAMTLGCGGYGGNITSDNISPRHLLNVKRLAYEVTPVVSRWDRGAGMPSGALSSAGTAPGPALPQAPVRPPAPTGISAAALSAKIDDFLSSRGYRGESQRAVR